MGFLSAVPGSRAGGDFLLLHGRLGAPDPAVNIGSRCGCRRHEKNPRRRAARRQLKVGGKRHAGPCKTAAVSARREECRCPCHVDPGALRRASCLPRRRRRIAGGPGIGAVAGAGAAERGSGRRVDAGSGAAARPWRQSRSGRRAYAAGQHRHHAMGLVQQRPAARAPRQIGRYRRLRDHDALAQPDRAGHHDRGDQEAAHRSSRSRSPQPDGAGRR